jgi:hypothetical protein
MSKRSEISTFEKTKNGFIHTVNYGYIINMKLLQIFEDDMTYGKLKYYSKSLGNYTEVKAKWTSIRNSPTIICDVWFDDILVLHNYQAERLGNMRFMLDEIEEKRLDQCSDDDYDDEYDDLKESEEKEMQTLSVLGKRTYHDMRMGLSEEHKNSIR